MDQSITILPAHIAHADAVYGLLRELEGPGLDRDAFYSVYAANLQVQTIRYFLAFVNGGAVGFISLHVQRLLHHTGLVGEIQELVVKEGLRGQGIGRVLFSAAKEVAKAAGCVQLEVCCRRERVQSLDFYKSVGMAQSHFKLCLTLTEGK